MLEWVNSPPHPLFHGEPALLRILAVCGSLLSIWVVYVWAYISMRDGEDIATHTLPYPPVMRIISPKPRDRLYVVQKPASAQRLDKGGMPELVHKQVRLLGHTLPRL